MPLNVHQEKFSMSTSLTVSGSLVMNTLEESEIVESLLGMRQKGEDFF